MTLEGGWLQCATGNLCEIYRDAAYVHGQMRFGRVDFTHSGCLLQAGGG